MGPDRNQELFRGYVKSEVDQLVSAYDRDQRAVEVLSQLSTEFSELPITAPVVESSIAVKLFALSLLSNDPLGFMGFNPMSMLKLERGEVVLNASAAPAHDKYQIATPDGNLELQTRAIHFLAPGTNNYGGHNDYDMDHKGLEFFGLNVFATKNSHDLEVIEEQDCEQKVSETEDNTSSSIPVSEAAKKIIEQTKKTEIVNILGEPLQGVTNIFGVRQKEHGTVKIYGIEILHNIMRDFPLLAGVALRDPDSRNKITFGLINGLEANITLLEGHEFENSLSEFKLAVDSLKFAKNTEESKPFTAQEIYAVKNPRGRVVTDEMAVGTY